MSLRALVIFTFFILTSCNLGVGGDAKCATDSCGNCLIDQVGVKICSMVSTPTPSESVTLVNYDSVPVNLNNWSLWDQTAWDSNSGAHTFNSGDVIAPGDTETFGTLPFNINDTGETIYLKNAIGVLQHQLSN